MRCLHSACSTACASQGTGSTSVATAPARLDALRRLRVTAVAAAKFHSVALVEDGRLFSWGFGRGGRTGERSASLSGVTMLQWAVTLLSSRGT